MQTDVLLTAIGGGTMLMTIINIFFLKRIENIKLFDKLMLYPLFTIILAFSLLLTCNPSNMLERFDFCYYAGLISFAFHSIVSMIKHKGIIGFYLAFLQTSIILLTALVMCLAGWIISCIAQISLLIYFINKMWYIYTKGCEIYESCCNIRLSRQLF